MEIEGLDGMTRDELLQVFRKHIMPKPQRRQKNETKQRSISEAVGITNEVKRIKLNRVGSQTPMDCTPAAANCDNGHKRTMSESCTSSTKRQKIQWP